jgi:hypothetical protein
MWIPGSAFMAAFLMSFTLASRLLSVAARVDAAATLRNVLLFMMSSVLFCLQCG